jgi:hypothetical protein
MEGEIRNKVAESTLITFDLEEYYEMGERVVFDIKDHLYQGLALREKEFRIFVKENDWSQYKDKNVAIICSADAIVPTWAYMLLVTSLSPFIKHTVYGDLDYLENYMFQKALSKIDLEVYKGEKIIIKGCGRYPVPEFAYVEITNLLNPIVSSLMYGEACSAVPVYKMSKKAKK